MSTTTRTRKTAKPSRLSAEQLAVCEARAILATVEEQATAEIARQGIAYPDGLSFDDEVALDVRCHDIREGCGVFLARAAVKAAERAVVAWCIEHAKRYSPAHAATLTDMHARAEKSVVYWPRLVELAMRLAA